MINVMRTTAKFFLLAAMLNLCFFSTGATAKMVSVAKEVINMRTGPSTRYKTQWQLGKGYPLMVVAHKGKWLKVKDFENDVGWVYGSLTSRKPHMVIKKAVVNIRSGPGTKYRIITQAKYGVVMKTLKQTKGWVKVRHASGTSGWMARPMLWGW
jgi:SH3-like domain-containing protein